jgi:hypothetical protein
VAVHADIALRIFIPRADSFSRRASTTMMRATAPPKQPGKMDGVEYASNVDHITYGKNIEVQHQNGECDLLGHL